MYHTDVGYEERLLNFVRAAAKNFQENPQHTSYGEIESGGYVALRWGLGNDCVLVFKLDEDFEPRVYGQAIGGL